MKRTYISAGFRVPAALSDEAAGVLTARGALGCAVQWPHRVRRSRATPVLLQAFFTRLSAAQLRAHTAALKSAGMLAGGIAAKPIRLTDPGWATLWKSRFKPLEIGRSLVIVPPWTGYAAQNRVPIIIEPGQGFGTGHHATTRSTLIELEAACARGNFNAALDVGTGSGVLAIAMARLGVRRILALDNDAMALENARHNAALNGCADAIKFSAAPVGAVRRRFPLIAANILSSTLIALAPELTRLLAPCGILILAGILKREAAQVMKHYAYPMKPVAARLDRGWSTLVLTLEG